MLAQNRNEWSLLCWDVWFKKKNNLLHNDNLSIYFTLKWLKLFKIFHSSNM